MDRRPRPDSALRRPLLGLLALGVAAGLFFRLKGERPAVEEGPRVEQGALVPPPRAAAPLTAPVVAPPHLPAGHPAVRGLLKAEKGAAPALGGPPVNGVVDFVVSGGLAIAYGDLILGQPEPGFDQKRGRAEAPRPQVWETADIPYAISPDLPDPKRVEEAIDYYNRNTTVRFVPYQGQNDALVFEPGPENCYSYLGKTGGLQPIRLAPGCHAPEIVHELMHALGFIHEQMRTDRDHYVEVLWDNIQESYRPQFAMAPEFFMEAEAGTPFDFHSAMMYRPEAFAVNASSPTMRARSGEAIAPVQQGLSEGDLFRIRRVYRR